MTDSISIHSRGSLYFEIKKILTNSIYCQAQLDFFLGFLEEHNGSQEILFLKNNLAIYKAFISHHGIFYNRDNLFSEQQLYMRKAFFYLLEKGYYHSQYLEEQFLNKKFLIWYKHSSLIIHYLDYASPLEFLLANVCISERYHYGFIRSQSELNCFLETSFRVIRLRGYTKGVTHQEYMDFMMHTLKFSNEYIFKAFDKIYAYIEQLELIGSEKEQMDLSFGGDLGVGQEKPLVKSFKEEKIVLL